MGGVVLVASVVVVAKKAHAQSATFPVFKHKVNLQPGGNFKFTVATNEPVNCKCTTNFNRQDAHGVGELAFTADNLGPAIAPIPRISSVLWSSSGNEHSGSLCPPSVVDTGFLTGAACPGGLSGQNQTDVAAAGGGPEPSGGGSLDAVQRQSRYHCVYAGSWGLYRNGVGNHSHLAPSAQPSRYHCSGTRYLHLHGFEVAGFLLPPRGEDMKKRQRGWFIGLTLIYIYEITSFKELGCIEEGVTRWARK